MEEGLWKEFVKNKNSFIIISSEIGNGSHILLFFVRESYLTRFYIILRTESAMSNNAVVHTEIYEERYVTGTQSIGIQNNHTHV